jgi:DegT/DnrJ/EryC1/StrS aminotransferase family
MTDMPSRKAILESVMAFAADKLGVRAGIRGEAGVLASGKVIDPPNFGESKHVERLKEPLVTSKTESSWLSSPLTIDPAHLANREELLRFLLSINIGIHLFFRGNLADQPDCRNVNFKIVGDTRSSESLTNRIFWVGAYLCLTNPTPAAGGLPKCIT